jgi:phosphoglucomutase
MESGSRLPDRSSRLRGGNAMTRAMEEYKRWIAAMSGDAAVQAELTAIRDDPAEIEDRYYKDLTFGTAGLRGIIGAGTNRMNRYTVARAAAGFASFLAGQGEAQRSRGVVISYDPRHFSKEFAWQTAAIFVGAGVRVYLSDAIRPVPMLSFAIRRFKAAAGVMITASHNPAKYNGFKAYGEDGGQLPPDAADQVSASMDQMKDLTQITWPDEQAVHDSGLLQLYGPEIDDAYQDMLLDLSLAEDAVRRHSDLKIVYTPLHGTGNKPVRRILEAVGFRHVLVVPEQEMPDPDFPTVAFPNPEERSALQLAISLAQREDADLVIATDPDADRTGLCVRNNQGEYIILSGNQIGQLLMDFILKTKQAAGTLPPDSFCITTVVSSKLTRRIAAAYGVTLFETLTGFKFIAELIKEHDENGSMHFQFGFEESFGYLAGRDVRDKDAVVTSMLIAEMAAVAKDSGQTLYERLQVLYERYGQAAEHTVAITIEGKEGLEKIKSCMAALRRGKAALFPGLPVRAVSDYLLRERLDIQSGQTTALTLDESDVLLFELDGIDWFCARPSGTEPKLKIYFGTCRDTRQAGEQALLDLRGQVETRIQSLL